ncbi:hypothetical protein, partial [Halorubrum sp. BV1]|uniref:hypothetical protein n=1 Tax=Halorubrum sp. BV1 TaxID=1498500 RepID=UPI001E65C784
RRREESDRRREESDRRREESDRRREESDRRRRVLSDAEPNSSDAEPNSSETRCHFKAVGYGFGHSIRIQTGSHLCSVHYLVIGYQVWSQRRRSMSTQYKIGRVTSFPVKTHVATHD